MRTVDEILRLLVEQQYQARGLIYREKNHGTVEVATFNITGDDRADFPGLPFVRFIATTEQDRVSVHPTLAEALNAIGIF